ncbi:MAG: YezD family protein [Planctomycetota bacterium]|nr:YezD family protein [Planctomycetota bacterium]
MSQNALSTREVNTKRASGDMTECRREQELQHIREALCGLSFGAVNIVVQDGVVVQIDRTEKRRLRRSSSSPESTCTIP